jgi:hypothetical protein
MIPLQFEAFLCLSTRISGGKVFPLGAAGRQYKAHYKHAQLHEHWGFAFLFRADTASKIPSLLLNQLFSNLYALWWRGGRLILQILYLQLKALGDYAFDRLK